MSESIKNALEQLWGVRFGPRLGFGRDGDVYLTDRNTAVKIFIANESFSRELQAYQVLTRLQIVRVAGHEVPQLLRFDESMMAIEMTVARPPFLLDFASAYPLPAVPDFPDDVWEDWRRQKQEEFGARWPDVEFILSEFQRLTDLKLLDVNPGNVRFANDPTPD